jgi:hypothetical protein
MLSQSGLAFHDRSVQRQGIGAGNQGLNAKTPRRAPRYAGESNFCGQMAGNPVNSRDDGLQAVLRQYVLALKL